MAAILGKRKRAQAASSNGHQKAESVKQHKPTNTTTKPNPSTETAETEDNNILQEILRRHFEQRFKPLPEDEKVSDATATEEQEEDEDEEEWGGISDEDEEQAAPVIEVVDHGKTRGDARGDLEQKAALRAFMSNKPPSIKTIAKSPLSTAKSTQADDEEATNLKHDVALQRLLSESHLLSSQPHTASSLEHTGKSRLRALDLRLQSLGAKNSMFTNQKMPMAERKGIHANRAAKEEKRRNEAKENGIILEKETRKSSGARGKMRDRGVGGPSVGRMRGGMLTLSKRDVAEIQGPSRGGGRGRVRGRGGKRR